MSADPAAGGVTVAGCGICQESLTKTSPESVSTDVNSLVTPCGHAFHARCINCWMTLQPGLHATCPNCRKEIRNKACSPLYLEEIDAADLERIVLADFLESTERLKQKLSSALAAEETAKRQHSDILGELESYKHGGNKKLRLEPDAGCKAAEDRSKIAALEAGRARLEADLEILQIYLTAERFRADNKVKLAEMRVKEAEHRGNVAEERAKVAEQRATVAEQRATVTEQRALIAEAGHRRAEAWAFKAQSRAAEVDKQLKTAQDRASGADNRLADNKKRIDDAFTALETYFERQSSQES